MILLFGSFFVGCKDALLIDCYLFVIQVNNFLAELLPTTFGGWSFEKGEKVTNPQSKFEVQRPYERNVDSYQYDADTNQWTTLTHSVSKYRGANKHPYRGRIQAAAFQIPRMFFPDC